MLGTLWRVTSTCNGSRRVETAGVFAFFAGYEPFAFGDAARQCIGDVGYEVEIWERLYDIRSLLACVLVTSKRDRLTAMEARRRLVIAADL